jgi:hypothetical protein
MVVGRKPFAGNSPLALAIEKIRGNAPQAAYAVPSLPPVWNSVIARMMNPSPERRFADVGTALRLLENSVERGPLLGFSRRQKQRALCALLLCAVLGLGVWGYSQSLHTPGAEALGFYRRGAHAQQIGLPWTATQLYEQGLARDSHFLAARAALAEAWLDLEQPARAKAVLESAAAERPRWQRVAEYESVLEQAVRARLRGLPKQAALLHRRAASNGPASEKPDLLMQEAMADVRAGAPADAMAIYAVLEKPGSVNRCPALMNHADLLMENQRFAARAMLVDSRTCFEATGDLDGTAQSEYWHLDPLRELVTPESVATAKRIRESAHNTGNFEQEIMAGSLLSTLLLQLGEDDESYGAFILSMQLADRHDLKFLSARVLDQRARYYFDKGDFLQYDNASSPEGAMARAAGMPWTMTEIGLRYAALSLRMGLPNQASKGIKTARDQLLLYPNTELSARTNELETLAAHTRGRPEWK